jgi:acetyl-CoA synthetase
VTGPATEAFRAARDLLLAHGRDYERAYAAFRWPELDEFNWALDWFDVIAQGNGQPALWIVEEDGREATWSFAQLSQRSNQLANWLRRLGARRGDRVLVMLGNQVELWETLLAAMKLGAVVIPASTLLRREDLIDRVQRGAVRHVIARAEERSKFEGIPGGFTRICVGSAGDGWLDYSEASGLEQAFEPDGATKAADPMLLYFTSGTTALPKLVEHSHASYPVGHLSTMYWIGVRPGDVHCNISSPGWAKHAWSNVFAPWNAEATVLIYNYERFSAPALLDVLARTEAATLCAPPTVWRMLIQEDLGRWPVRLREVVSAGEPLNPEVIDQVERAWGLLVRDGYGQTETTALAGNTPGQPVKRGSMGRPLPGYHVTLLDLLTGAPAAEGEICLDLSRRPLGLMKGYRAGGEHEAEAMRGGFYHTGDVAAQDEDGYLTYIGRADDVFKASDYRISPFELESVLIEHPAVAEAAVVPSPDPVRTAVPKAFVTLAAGSAPTRETALSIFQHSRERLAPFKRLRRLEFSELPKTISGKIRRVELREAERRRRSEAGAPARSHGEYWEEDFPELRV